jgi:1-acyl-sn-glycerol-3-phosphate acyltransferase
MSIFRHFIAIATTFLFIFTTVLALIPLLPLALTKWLIPFPAWQKLCNRWLDWIASHWMSMNAAHQNVLTGTDIQLMGDYELRRDEWYMMLANHQSWVDILVLLRVFNGRIPYLKFFLKKSLIWVPLLGVAWWALEFPFMRRYSKEEIARNPALKGRDIEETRRACEKYRHSPVTIINFLEGTRFTPQKYAAQNSPYQHLLIPRAGGMAFTLAAMNGQLHSLLDVTIYYPDGIPSYWHYASGKVKQVQVHLRQRPIPASLLGDYTNDLEFRQRFQQWVNELWEEKDQLLSDMALERASH